MRIVTEGPFPVAGNFNRGAPPRYQHFPSMELLDSGELLLCCKELEKGMDDPLGRIRLFRSPDNGRSWGEGLAPTCHDLDAFPEKGYLMAHITEIDRNELIAVYSRIDTDLSRPLFNPVTDGMQSAVVRVVRSSDNGMSWSMPEDIVFSSEDIIVPGKVILLRDGSLGFPCEMHDHWDGGYREGNCSRFITSCDGGATFCVGKVMAGDEGILYGDARPVWIGDTLRIFFWTLDLGKMQDLPVHFVETRDNARSWSPPQPVGITTQIISPVYLEGGVMIAVHQDRFSEDPGLKAILSYDNGISWDHRTEITLFGAGSRPDGTNPFAQFDQFRFGYSSLIQTGPLSCLASFWHADGIATAISVIELQVVE